VPIYEYACRSCEHQFETIQKATEEPLSDCPACGESELRKLLSAPVFRLKGSGWYETDFKTGDKRNVTDSESRDNGDAGDNGKPEATADAEGKTTSGSNRESKAESRSAGKSNGGKDAAKPASTSTGGGNADAG